MPLQHACFLSYPRCDDPVVTRVVELVYEQLQRLLNFYFAKATVYVDDALRGGRLLEDTVQRELCHSASMVLLYNPSPDHARVFTPSTRQSRSGSVRQAPEAPAG